MTQRAHHISGRTLRDHLFKQATEEVSALAKKNIHVGLAVVMVGDNPASKVYVQSKNKAAEKLNIKGDIIHLDNDTTQEKLEQTLSELSQNSDVHGILLQLPLPQGLNAQAAIECIDPLKDVDGLTIRNAGLLEIGAADGHRACTPLGVMRLLESADVSLKGLDVVMIGRSNLVGRPLASMMGLASATVTICHRHTVDLTHYTKNADVVVVATGQPGLIKGEHLKPGAVVVDVGITPGVDENGNRKLFGDCDYQSCAQVASLMTPVPGGVGPMTVTSLMTNVIDAACLQEKLPVPNWSVKSAEAIEAA